MRTIVVGDVHGCSGELETLLEQVMLGPGDRLIMVGDLVARGPDSRGVLATVRAAAGRSVLGNHEAKILSWRGRGGPLRPGPMQGAQAARAGERGVLPALPPWV